VTEDATSTSPPSPPSGSQPPAGPASTAPPASGAPAPDTRPPAPVPGDEEFSPTERVLIAEARNPDAVRSMLRTERGERRDAEARLKAAEAKLAEIDNANKTEIEREREARTKAEQELTELRREKLAMDVAAAEGIPEFAKYLHADTKERLTREAQQLREALERDAQARGVRRADLGAGSRLANGGAGDQGGFDALIRRKAGRAT
jgi:hypothetical protein